MIQSFRCKDTQKLVGGGKVARFRSIEAQARRKLYQLHMVRDVLEMRIPPGNRLEKLHGDREGQWSVRINDQWRLCFKWGEEGAMDVEIVDYH